MNGQDMTLEIITAVELGPAAATLERTPALVKRFCVSLLTRKMFEGNPRFGAVCQETSVRRTGSVARMRSKSSAR